MDTEKENYLTYQDIRKIALSYGVKDTKVSIGMWAKLNGFSNKRKMTKGKTQIFYTKDKCAKVEQIERRSAGKQITLNES